MREGCAGSVHVSHDTRSFPPTRPPPTACSTGPRSWTFAEGQRKAALEAILDASDVVCMTQDEAEAVTGLADAQAQAAHILDRPGARTEWCVIKRGAEGAILASKTLGGPVVYSQQALRVDVRDTGAFVLVLLEGMLCWEERCAGGLHFAGGVWRGALRGWLPGAGWHAAVALALAVMHLPTHLCHPASLLSTRPPAPAPCSRLR